MSPCLKLLSCQVRIELGVARVRGPRSRDQEVLIAITCLPVPSVCDSTHLCRCAEPGGQRGSAAVPLYCHYLYWYTMFCLCRGKGAPPSKKAPRVTRLSESLCFLLFQFTCDTKGTAAIVQRFGVERSALCGSIISGNRCRMTRIIRVRAFARLSC